MKTLMELTDDTTVNAWVPTQAWADLIMEASACYGQLSGVITAVDYDLAAGNGNVVNVRYFPARTAQGPFDCGCECLSEASTALGVRPITIQQYGDYDKMCEYSLWKAKGPVKEGTLNEMAKGLAVARDAAIWTALTARIGSYVTYTAMACSAPSATDAESTYCCTGRYRKSLYNSIVSLTQEMKGGCLNPDTVIMHPTVSKWFYMMDYNELPQYSLQFTNGKLTLLNGLKVIETGNATSCNAIRATGSTTSVMAVVIDSSRAVGEAWGKHPEFYEDFVPDCNYWKEVVWMYWGCAALDPNAVATIRNPYP